MNDLYGLITESIVPVRSDASEKAEMVHQLLFGETVILQKENQNWFKVKILYDNYEGWLDKKMMTILDETFFNQWNSAKKVVTQKEFAIEYKNGSTLFIHAGSEVCLDNALLAKIGFHTNVQSGGLTYSAQNEFIPHIQSLYLNAPYLWGGRSPYGLDCSGFTQIAYKLLGIAIPRDASQQALSEKGKEVSFITEAQTGDLAFFDNHEGLITHVGILINNSQIIHASGRVRIDRIDNQGIYNSGQENYTHKLRLIKRFW